MWHTDSLISDDSESKQGKAGVSSFIMNRTIYGQIREHEKGDVTGSRKTEVPYHAATW